jgi:hypothetical protein
MPHNFFSRPTPKTACDRSAITRSSATQSQGQSRSRTPSSELPADASGQLAIELATASKQKLWLHFRADWLLSDSSSQASQRVVQAIAGAADGYRRDAELEEVWG